MRAKEFLINENAGSITDSVANALPATYIMPELTSQDPYMQYRFGLALASARAKADGEVTFDSESNFGENMVVVARSEEEQKTLAMALALFGTKNSSSLISTSKSQESSDVNKQSPVTPNTRKLNKSQ